MNENLFQTCLKQNEISLRKLIDDLLILTTWFTCQQVNEEECWYWSKLSPSHYPPAGAFIGLVLLFWNSGLLPPPNSLRVDQCQTEDENRVKQVNISVQFQAKRTTACMKPADKEPQPQSRRTNQQHRKHAAASKQLVKQKTKISFF